MTRTKLYTVRYANAITGETVQTVEMSEGDKDDLVGHLLSIDVMPTATFTRYADEPRVVPNPVVRKTALRAYPGWTVRQYANGIFDATNGIALTLGCSTFTEAVALARAS